MFHLKTREMQRGYNFGPKKMFSGMKSDFSRILLDSGGKYRIATNRSLLEIIFCDVISLKAERPITLNFACVLVLCRPITSAKFQINQLTLTLFSGSGPKSPRLVADEISKCRRLYADLKTESHYFFQLSMIP